MKKKRIVSKGINKILLILIILIIGFLVYIVKNNQSNKMAIEEILSEVENIEANLNEYIVYGTHLNIKGEIKDSIKDIKQINLVLAEKDDKEEKIALKYEQNGDKISFYTSELINRGIDLEKVSVRKLFHGYRS